MTINSKQQKLIKAIFEKPTRKNLTWKKIEALLESLGCDIKEGNGSRIKVIYNGKPIGLHRPHPKKEALPYVVELVRDFLKEVIGVEP